MKAVLSKTLGLALATVGFAGVCALPTAASFSVINTPYPDGTADWLADVRFRNFTADNNGNYEMIVNYSPTRTPGSLQVNGNVPPGNSAYWAENNSFWITYDPLANSGAGNVSLRLVGSGRTSYDVTIGHAPDAVTAGPVNYIVFDLWDRNAFPTIPGGLTLSSLDGVNLGTFELPSAGIENWAIIDTIGSGPPKLNDGFVLQGSFIVDVTKLDGGKEGDKIIFGIGNNSLVDQSSTDAPEPSQVAMSLATLLGVGGFVLRQKFSRKSAK